MAECHFYLMNVAPVRCDQFGFVESVRAKHQGRLVNTTKRKGMDLEKKQEAPREGPNFLCESYHIRKMDGPNPGFMRK